VTFTSTVTATATAAATAAATTLVSSPDNFVSNVASAKTSVSVGASAAEQAQINAMQDPTVSAASPAVTEMESEASSGDNTGLIVTIVLGVLAGLIVLAGITFGIVQMTARVHPEDKAQAWQPPPIKPVTEKNPRPEWLPETSNVKQLDVPAERWAISLGDIYQFFDGVRQTQEYKDLQERVKKGGTAFEDDERFAGPDWKYPRNGCVNMYHINDHFIIPWTAGTGNSVALLMNQETKGQAAHAMTTHAWGESMDELEDALQAFQKAHNLPDGFRVWLCTLSMYQPNDVLTVKEQVDLDPPPFSKVIQSEGVSDPLEYEHEKGQGLIAIHTTTQSIYKRLWCPYEINEATSMRIRIYAAASGKYVEELQTKKDTWVAYYSDEYPDTSDEELFEMAAHKELNVDTESAGCSDPDDEKKIRAKIKSSGGFHLLDKTIFKLRFKLAKELMGQLRARLSVHIHNPPEAETSGN